MGMVLNMLGQEWCGYYWWNGRWEIMESGFDRE